MKRKLKLTITKIYRQTAVFPIVFRANCPICLNEVEMLTTSEAARFLQIDETELNWLLTLGNVHATQTESGNSRVCKNSLFQ
ncbi:MAG: hypothetical protein M3209_18790 [Acidobacteriota bacterium]|nr:hypothetical protein [Acidobacteriota bacterium]